MSVGNVISTQNFSFLYIDKNSKFSIYPPKGNPYGHSYNTVILLVKLFTIPWEGEYSPQ